MLRIRSLLAHAKVRFFATSAPKVYTATDLKGWGVSRVVEYAEKELELGAKAASVLREQEIIGKSLLNLSKEDLLRANMPLGPATILAAAIAKLPRPSEDTVTLTFKSKGGNPFSATFTPDDFKTYVATRSVFHMTKDGSRKREIRTLDEARSVDPPDYLLLATPFDTVADLEGFSRNQASGLEQQTTRSIAYSPVFLHDYGPLTALAGGESIIFYGPNNSKVLEVDGIVKNLLSCLIHNEAKQTPNEEDVEELLDRTQTLQDIIDGRKNVHRTSPPNVMEQLGGIKKIVPVLSGYLFKPEIAALCRDRKVTMFTTNGEGFSIKA